MKTVTTLAALLAASLATAPAAMAQAPAPRTIAVHYADLDLGTGSGRATFDHRLRHAIRTACGVASSSDLSGQNAVVRCRSGLKAALAPRRDAAFAAAGRTGTTLVARR